MLLPQITDLVTKTFIFEPLYKICFVLTLMSGSFAVNKANPCIASSLKVTQSQVLKMKFTIQTVFLHL